MQDGFWDERAPHGANGYAYCRGEYVTGWIPARSASVRMREGVDVVSRIGVAELSDGRVYHYAIRIPELWEGKPLRVATLLRAPFGVAARMMLDFETCVGRADSASLAELRKEVDAL